MMLFGIPGGMLRAVIGLVLALLLAQRVLPVAPQSGRIAIASLLLSSAATFAAYSADLLWFGLLVGASSAFPQSSSLAGVTALGMMVVQFVPPLANALALGGLGYAIWQAVDQLRRQEEEEPA